MMGYMSIYLDHNASAPLLPEARQAILEALELVGNPSSVHKEGRLLRSAIDLARDQVAKLCGAEAKQVVFTGSATEAITQAIVGGVKAFNIQRILVCAADHAASLRAAEICGVNVSVVDVDENGVIDLNQLEHHIKSADEAGEKLLVAVHWVNNETGVVQPIEKIGMKVGPTQHVLCVDAVQAFGRLDIDFASSPIDMMSISAHKIGGPSGIGALLLKGHADSVKIVPGGGQEQGRRGGTEATALIAGFGAACAAYKNRFIEKDIHALARLFEERLSITAADVVVFGKEASRIGNTVNFAVPDVKNTVAMMGLDLDGIAISSGSACSSGKVGRSHVLSAMGVDPALADCSLRVSFGWSSTSDDVEAFFKAFMKVLNRHHKFKGAEA